MIMASKSTIARLPGYLSYLIEKKNEGVINMSSAVIAEDMRLSAIQVRKDLALVSSIAGKPKLGFSVSEIIDDIKNFLGYNDATEAILVGCGGLGKTLLSYNGFENYGLKIVAAFDLSSEVIGKEFNGKKVFHLEKLKNIAERMNIKLGIITVPKEKAQGIADLMIEAGIKGIWNFAPIHIRIPSNIAIKNEDMASSLAILSKRLTDVLNK